MVTHDPQAAALADRILFLADGRIVKEIRRVTAAEVLAAMQEVTYVLTDTLNKAFTGVFASAYRNSSVVITPRDIVKGSNSGPTVPGSVLAKVKALPGVADAAGT